MVDTVRTLAALQALLADNTSGDISPQDIRDLAVSVFPPQYAGARISDPSGTAQAISAATWTSVTFDTEDFDSGDYADLGTSTTRLTVPDAGLVIVGGNVVTANASSSAVLLSILKDGTTRFASASSELTVTLGQRVSTSVLDVAAAGAFYELQVWTEAGEDVPHTTEGPRFWIAYLGQTPV